MPIDTISMTEFLRDNRISMTAERVAANPNFPDSDQMDHWKVVFTRKQASTVIYYTCRDIGYGVETGRAIGTWGDSDTWGKREFKQNNGVSLYLFPDEIEREGTASKLMTTYFSMGYGHNGKAPKAGDVLDCLASDANGVDSARSFDEFCSDYGYDVDSRKAEKVYKACVHSAKRLKTFLGSDLYETLLYSVERG